MAADTAVHIVVITAPERLEQDWINRLAHEPDFGRVERVGVLSAALEMVQQTRPDLVIVDYILNGVDGGEVCQQIKVDNKTSNLPVMLMSAYPKVFKPLKDYGCDDFIAKPFDLDDFVVRIKKLMNDGMNKNLHAI